MLTENRAVCTKPLARTYTCCNCRPVFLTPNLKGQMHFNLHCIFKFSSGRDIVGQNAGNDIKSSYKKEPIQTEARWNKVAAWCFPHGRLMSVSSRRDHQQGWFVFSFLFILFPYNWRFGWTLSSIRFKCSMN